jgi:hypothetical protein
MARGISLSPTLRPVRFLLGSLAAILVAGCNEIRPTGTTEATPEPGGVSLATVGSAGVTVVNVTNDTTAQNETPLAVNPLDANNLLTGNNDWNYNDGCGVNATFDGGKKWTRTLPRGFIPGITKYTNDPSVPGTGIYDFGGDPAVAFGIDGTAYFACFGYQAIPPFGVVLLLSRSFDGGRTWLSGGKAQPLTQAAIFQGNGKSRGSMGQFPDHEAMHVGADGTIYVTWAQFNGNSAHSPIYLATSQNDGLSFSQALKITSGSVRNDQDARVVTKSDGSVAFLVFDNSVQGGKGTVLYVSRSTDHGASWSAPARFATFAEPVCLFPPYCFNIDGGQFRGPGSYPAPAYDPVRDRLYVAYGDIVNGRGQIFLTWASASNLSAWSTPAVVAEVPRGDRFAAEMSIAANGRIDIQFYDRSYSGNALVDVTYASSTDGGATWKAKRITGSGFDPSLYGVPGGEDVRPFIGDYNGIVSLADRAAMTWTGAGKTYGALPTNLEIYFASVLP